MPLPPEVDRRGVSVTFDDLGRGKVDIREVVVVGAGFNKVGS